MFGEEIPKLDALLRGQADISIADSEVSLGKNHDIDDSDDNDDESFDGDDDVEDGPTNSTMIDPPKNSPAKMIPLCKTDFLQKHRHKTVNRDGKQEWNPQLELYKIPIEFQFQQKDNEDFFEVLPAKKTISVFYYKKFDREEYEQKRTAMSDRGVPFPLETLTPFKKRLKKDPFAFLAVPISSKIEKRLRSSFPHTPTFLELIQWRPLDNSTGPDLVLKDELAHEWFEINQNLDFSPETGIFKLFLTIMSKLKMF